MSCENPKIICQTEIPCGECEPCQEKKIKIQKCSCGGETRPVRVFWGGGALEMLTGLPSEEKPAGDGEDFPLNAHELEDIQNLVDYARAERPGAERNPAIRGILGFPFDELGTFERFLATIRTLQEELEQEKQMHKWSGSIAEINLKRAEKAEAQLAAVVETLKKYAHTYPDDGTSMGGPNAAQSTLSSLPDFKGEVLVDVKTREPFPGEVDRLYLAAHNKSLQAENERLRRFVRCSSCHRRLNGFETDDPCPWGESNQCDLQGIKAALEKKS